MAFCPNPFLSIDQRYASLWSLSLSLSHLTFPFSSIQSLISFLELIYHFSLNCYLFLPPISLISFISPLSLSLSLLRHRSPEYILRYIFPKIYNLLTLPLSPSPSTPPPSPSPLTLSASSLQKGGVYYFDFGEYGQFCYVASAAPPPFLQQVCVLLRVYV